MIRRPPSPTLFPSTPLSRPKPEGVARMRARGEREKRKLKGAPGAPKRRRAVKAAEPVAVLPEARPKRRRRTAAEVAAAEAEAQAEAAVEAERELKAREALEAAKVIEEEKPSLEERAAALFKDLPVALEPAGEAQAATPFAASATASSVAPAAPAPPRSVIPTPVRPKPVASATPGGPVPPPPPRPVASAAPGAIPLERSEEHTSEL